MALVLLPCDLPTWPTLQRHLNSLKQVRDTAELRDALFKIHSLCNTSLEPDDDVTDVSLFDRLVEFIENEMSDVERDNFFRLQLPSIVHWALQLRQLKPVQGFHYSLQQQRDRVQIDRRLVASLVAHSLLSTFPRRTLKTHPTLQDFNFGPFFVHLHRKSQRTKLRCFLHYFHRLEEQPPKGHVTFARQVMSSRDWCTLDQWLTCQRPLCPVVVRHDQLPAPDQVADHALQVCFASARLGGHVLQDGGTQECAAFSSHPELLSLLPYVESLEDNEAITAHGLQRYSIIHDLKNKAHFDPAPTASPSSEHSAHKAHSTMCLIDAEDYSDLPIRQYEEDNVLRELNKCYLGFQQEPLQRLPPVGASRNASPTQQEAVAPPSPSPDREDWTRSTTLVEPDGLSCDRKSSTSTEVAAERRESQSSTALLYGGGRNAPLTLNKASFLKELDVNANDPTNRRPSIGVISKQEGSVYASCQSEDKSDEEFRSAHTSFDEDSELMALRNKCTPPRQFSSELSETDSEIRRPESRGFILENLGEDMEDSFSGDGLEKERQWLADFRERRGRSRSGHRGENAKESRDSSRYSFSSEYSSELDELYDEFSHWLENPDGKNPDKRDVAVFRFAHSLLKRALSDSFASVAMKIENFSDGKKSIKDIKLSSSAKSEEPSSGGDGNSSKRPKQRSRSLAEDATDDRMVLQLAKELLHRAEQREEPKLTCNVPEKVVLLDRMAPDVVAASRMVDQRVKEVANEDAECRESNESDEGAAPPAAPLNPTPPRTRRGSWIFKKSRERNKGGKSAKDLPKQRARSNSVPAVMELTQLTLWHNQPVSLLTELRPSIPDIIVSVENSEEDDCFLPLLAGHQRRHQSRSYDGLPLNRSSESLLSDDVVEGFSWTMAETIIEEILKDLGTKKTPVQLQVPAKHGATFQKHKRPQKGILKNSSNDSLYRSHSGSLEPGTDSSCGGSKMELFGGCQAESSAATAPANSGEDAHLSWSHRSTSMPSLRAIDELEQSQLVAEHSDSQKNTDEESETAQASTNGSEKGGMRPILTGNWGCGSQAGDAQLKSMIQWMAASRSGAPCLIYYTASAASVVKMDIVCRVILDRHWTVGDLAKSILRYCRSRLDPLLQSKDSGRSDASQPLNEASRTAANAPRLLFDDLLGQLPLKQTEL